MKQFKLNKKQIIIGSLVVILLAGISVGIYFLVRHFQKSSSPISSTGGVVSRVDTSASSCQYSSLETPLLSKLCQVTPYGDGLPRTTYGLLKISGPSSCADHIETRTEVCTDYNPYRNYDSDPDADFYNNYNNKR